MIKPCEGEKISIIKKHPKYIMTITDDNNSGYHLSTFKHRHIVFYQLCINSHEA